LHPPSQCRKEHKRAETLILERHVTLRRAFYGTYMIILISVFLMTGWTSSIASSVNSSSCSKTETYQDLYVSGAVQASMFTVLYESVSVPVWFNISLDFSSGTPINLTLENVEITEASSVGETPFNYRTIGISSVTAEIVNASNLRIHGRASITPIMMEGNVTLGLALGYWIYTTNNTFHGGWGDLFMFPVTIVPSVFILEGWIYFNAVTLSIGVILLIWYSTTRKQG
jgi:hypothetical protein